MKVLQQLSIRSRILLIPLLASLGFAGYFTYSYVVLTDHSARFFYIRDISFPVIEQIDHGLVRLERIRETLNAAVAGDEAELIDDADRMAEETRQLLQTLQQLVPAQRSVVATLSSDFQRYYQQARALSLAMLDGSADFSVIQPQIEQMGAALVDIQSGMKGFRQQSHQQFLDTIDEASRSAHESLQFGIAAGSSLLLCLLLVAFSVARQVSRNLQRVVESLHNIASGEGDLSQRLPASDDREMRLLSQNFNLFVDKIDRLIGSLKQSSARLIPVSGELARNNQQGLQHIEQQQRFSSDVIASMDSMATSTEDVIGEIGTVCTVVTAGNEAVSRGRQAIDATASSILELSEEMHQAIAAIGQLKEDSDTVGEIIDVINAIAEQTNLLALNAAIEAARAGDAGRGFAVVADEVRGLANKTRASTQMVEEMIDRIQASTQAVVRVMEQGQANVDQSVGQVKGAQQELNQLCEVISRINEVLGRVSAATEVQQQRIDTVRMLAGQMADISDETAAIASASARSGNEMVEVGQQMDGLVGVFIVSARSAEQVVAASGYSSRAAVGTELAEKGV